MKKPITKSDKIAAATVIINSTLTDYYENDIDTMKSDMKILDEVYLMFLRTKLNVERIVNAKEKE